ncbi:hypothetical protein FXO37_28176 [Capsicum annuum]|nr:hypothetical protein FXO37_28176 [Capsicum annuum]
MNYEGNESPKGSSSPQEFFEFFSENSDYENYTFSDIIFCGKNIRHENDIKETELEQTENLSPLFRCDSFHGPCNGLVNQNRAKLLASLARFSGSQNLERVNISGLTSMSSKSRRRMFMFGPVKFNPEMELSEIKQRQSRRQSMTTTRSSVGGEVVIPGSNVGATTTLVKSKMKKKKDGSTRKMMELSRPHFVNVLAKSLRCFSMRKHCMALP